MYNDIQYLVFRNDIHTQRVTTNVDLIHSSKGWAGYYYRKSLLIQSAWVYFVTMSDSMLRLGTRLIYLFVRETLDIRFNDGEETLDTSLQSIYDAMKDGRLDEMVLELAYLTRDDQIEQESVMWFK